MATNWPSRWETLVSQINPDLLNWSFPRLFGETASDLTLGSTAGQSTPDSSACGGPSMSNSDLSSSSGDWTKLKSNASNASSSPQWSPPPRQSYASVVTNSRRSGPQQLKSDGELDLEDAVEGRIWCLYIQPHMFISNLVCGSIV